MTQDNSKSQSQTKPVADDGLMPPSRKNKRPPRFEHKPSKERHFEQAKEARKAVEDKGRKANHAEKGKKM